MLESWGRCLGNSIAGLISFLGELGQLGLESVDFFLGISHDEVAFLVDFLKAFDSLGEVGLGLDFDEGLDFFFFAVVFGGLGVRFWVAV
jgi:hypothetical protein